MLKIKLEEKIFWSFLNVIVYTFYNLYYFDINVNTDIHTLAYQCCAANNKRYVCNYTGREEPMDCLFNQSPNFHINVFLLLA